MTHGSSHSLRDQSGFEQDRRQCCHIDRRAPHPLAGYPALWQDELIVEKNGCRDVDDDRVIEGVADPLPKNADIELQVVYGCQQDIERVELPATHECIVLAELVLFRIAVEHAGRDEL